MRRPRVSTWGAYGASKAAAAHLTQIGTPAGTEGFGSSRSMSATWTHEHDAAVPDADRSTLKQPETAANDCSCDFRSAQREHSGPSAATQ